MDRGDWLFEALLTLGWTIRIGDGGIIHAEPGTSTAAGGGSALHAIIQDDGAIVWECFRRASPCVVKQARIRALRKRVARANPSAGGGAGRGGLAR